ncbi:ATP-binding protein [candidate division TA06 bacterium]|uniref:ATP-binding protein n=1 Tax=candidate division TA06 bacterium TaxID=2250710 RepID=A0A933IB19_UNCT6|nr:ATP-binding protein [candidate division TA06 bacterium]
MNEIIKSKSPFYPGQPVPVEFFTGRLDKIEKISRAAKQVELGKPQAIFLTGEYGIGKSSLASYMRYYAERHNNLLGIHVLLGGTDTLEELATKTVEAVIKAQIYEPTFTEKVGDLLSKYIGKQEVFGFSVNFEALKADGLNLSKGYLPFLRDLLSRFKDVGTKGILLILDEINGITRNNKFAHFIKGLVDENAISKEPLPLLLMLCGVEERRKEMIGYHQPIERIFDIVEIEPMSNSDMRDFFARSFESVNMKINDDAMESLCHYSAGFPKIMHIIGDATYWLDKDNIIDKTDSFSGIFMAVEDVGRKFVDSQVLQALKSKDYHSILNKLVKRTTDLSFKKNEIIRDLSDNEKKKFNNFLQRMKRLKVVRSGLVQGDYIFNSRLVWLYIFLNTIQKEQKAN